MRVKLLHILILISHQCTAQALLMDWIWQNGKSPQLQDITGVSTLVKFENIYGSNELTALTGSIRYSSTQFRSIAGIKLSALPTTNFNLVSIGLFYVLQAQRNWNLGILFDQSRFNTRELSSPHKQSLLSIWASINKSPYLFSGEIQYQRENLFEKHQVKIRSF